MPIVRIAAPQSTAIQKLLLWLFDGRGCGDGHPRHFAISVLARREDRLLDVAQPVLAEKDLVADKECR